MELQKSDSQVVKQFVELNKNLDRHRSPEKNKNRENEVGTSRIRERGGNRTIVCAWKNRRDIKTKINSKICSMWFFNKRRISETSTLNNQFPP